MELDQSESFALEDLDEREEWTDLEQQYAEYIRLQQLQEEEQQEIEQEEQEEIEPEEEQSQNFSQSRFVILANYNLAQIPMQMLHYPEILLVHQWIPNDKRKEDENFVVQYLVQI